jgi:putative ABC transport system permease protein
MIPVSYNVRNLAVRKTTTIASAGGIALVVFVLASALMLSEGIKRTLVTSGRAENAVVLRKGSDAELSSSIEDSSLAIVRSAPGIAKASDGQAVALGELVVVAFMKTSDGKGRSNVMIRGVPDRATDFRKEVRLIDGRAPRPGTDEVMVGIRVRDRFEGLKLGQSFELRKNRPFTVVGVFGAAGTSFESEVWGDINVIRDTFGRHGVVSSARVRLESASRFDAFEAAIEQDKRLGLDALPELEFYEKQSEGTSKFIMVLGMSIAVLFAIGAMIGAMITMDATVSQRTREIGVLRALGFSRFGVMLSFLLESLVLSLTGGLLGLLVALGMKFVKFSMMNFATWSEVVFEFVPTPQILLTALLSGGLMGVFGGFFPALKAASVSPTEAMRD